MWEHFEEDDHIVVKENEDMVYSDPFYDYENPISNYNIEFNPIYCIKDGIKTVRPVLIKKNNVIENILNSSYQIGIVRET